MANVKISALSAASELAGTEKMPAVQTSTKYTTPAQLLAYVETYGEMKFADDYVDIPTALLATAGGVLCFPAGTYNVDETWLLQSYTHYIALGEVIFSAQGAGTFTTCKDENAVDVVVNGNTVRAMIDVNGANNITMSGNFQFQGSGIAGLCAMTATQNPAAGHAASSSFGNLHIEGFSFALGGFTIDPVFTGCSFGVVRTKQCVDDIYVRGNSFDDAFFNVLRIGEAGASANKYDGCAGISLLDDARMFTVGNLFLRPDTEGSGLYYKYGAYLAANAVLSAQKAYVEAESKEFFLIAGAGCLLLLGSLKVSNTSDTDAAHGNSVIAVDAPGATVRLGVDQRYAGATNISSVVQLKTHSTYYGSSRIVEIDSAVPPSTKELIAYDGTFTSGNDHVTVKSRDGIEHYRHDGTTLTKTQDAAPEYFPGTVTTTGTAEELVQTITFPAKTLRQDGQTMRLRVWGKTAATANNKRLRIEFGGTAVLNTTLVAVNNLSWMFELLIQRTAIDAQQCIATGTWNGAVWPPTVTQTTEDFASDQNLDIYLTSSTASGGITIHGRTLDFI